MARTLAPAAGLLLLGLLLVALAATLRWLTAVPADPDIPGSSRVPLKGSSLVPAAVPLALMATAGLAAAAAAGAMARGVLRAAAAVLVLLAGIGVLLLGGRVAGDPRPAVAHVEAARQAGATQVTDRTPAPLVSLLGGACLAAAGGVALATRRRWPGLAVRYERDRDQPSRSGARPASTWDALERGDDPTAGER